MDSSLYGKPLRSFVALTLMGIILWAFTVIATLSLRNSAEHFVSKRAPAVEAALVAEAGIQRSLAGLRGWVTVSGRFKTVYRCLVNSVYIGRYIAKFIVLSPLNNAWIDFL